jgi:hypothetical protein
MVTRRLLLLLLLPFAAGCSLALGGTSAHPRALWEDDATIRNYVPIGGGWYRYTGTTFVPMVGSLALGVNAGQKYMRLEGGLSDREATPGSGAERHVDLNLGLWRLGASCSFGIFDQWVDYAGGFRMAWRGKVVAPRLSIAPTSWLSLYAGYGFLSGRDLTVGRYDPDVGWVGTAFDKASPPDDFGKWKTGKGSQKFAGADLTVFRLGRGKLGVKVEYQRTESGALAVPGADAGARFRSAGVSTEVYLGSW